MDLPGRRSHEYFPELSSDGKWLIWAATQRGHDHDTADYEIYLWQVGSSPDKAVRLTHNSGNDRWPDLFLPGAASQSATAAAESAAEPAPAAQPEPPAGDATAAPDAPEKLAMSAPADGQAPDKKKGKKGNKKRKKKADAAPKSDPAQP
jgi:hypothetical protein